MTQINHHISQSGMEQEIAKITTAFSAQARKPGFVHLLSKSLPRSGHHHLVGILKQLYGQAFEYCEYYQPSEDRCCKQQPCTRFCNIERVADGATHVSMQKSHDYELEDQEYAPSGWLKYIIMTRDFKDAVSSEVKLYLIDRFSGFLAAHQIDIKEIMQHHDKSLYRKALALIDDADFHVPPHEITPLFNERFAYYKGFTNKWVKFANEHKDHAIHIEYNGLFGADRRRTVNDLVDLIGIPTAVPVDVALAGEPVMTLGERLKEESRAARKLIAAHENLLNYYDISLKQSMGRIPSWRWV